MANNAGGISDGWVGHPVRTTQLREEEALNPVTTPSTRSLNGSRTTCGTLRMLGEIRAAEHGALSPSLFVLPVTFAPDVINF